MKRAIVLDPLDFIFIGMGVIVFIEVCCILGYALEFAEHMWRLL